MGHLAKIGREYIMCKYRVLVVDQTVHRWGEDGQGDYVCTKGGYHVGDYPTLDAAKSAIDDHFGYALGPDHYQDDYISATLIEDKYAYADPDGGYIVDYTLCIERVERVSFLDLQEAA